MTLLLVTRLLCCLPSLLIRIDSVFDVDLTRMPPRLLQFDFTQQLLLLPHQLRLPLTLTNLPNRFPSLCLLNLTPGDSGPCRPVTRLL